VSEEPRRLAQQSADVDQVNDQKVDQANTQDASHHSEAKQELALQSSVSQDQEHHINVMVHNHLTGSAVTAGTLTGLVGASHGGGIPQATVQLFFGPLVGIPVAVESTDQTGRFRFADLPPGFYSLRVAGLDGAAAEQWHLRVYAGQECRTQIRLPAGGPDRAVRSRRRAPAAANPEVAG
jgi:hypothetical protein